MSTVSDLQNDLALLDRELIKLGESRSVTICGGTALQLLGITERFTRDIDVVEPAIDEQLKRAAQRVAKARGYPEEWLNGGPASLAKELPAGWQARTESVFTGVALEVKVLGRLDLLATKVYALCDRGDDFEDVIRMKPTRDEMAAIKEWVLERDASPLWGPRVESCYERLQHGMHRDKGMEYDE